MSDAQRVRILFADQLNLARGKYVTVDDARCGHSRLCVGAYAVTYGRRLTEAPGAHLLEGLPDMEARFDPAELRSCWDGRSLLAIADLYFRDQPFPLCGRGALKRAIAQWRELGFDPVIGIETEAYVFKRHSDGSWKPYDTPGAFVYGTGPFSDPDGVVDLIWDAAEKFGLPVESINAEFDAPQFELTLKHDDALKAADDIFLFRQMARELLLQKGYLLSFLPKPLPELSGSGLHVNLSFRNHDGSNAFARTGGGELMPELLKQCIAGLLNHHEGLAGLLAPTVNSYERLKPASLTGYWANWGYDHRGVAVRVSRENGHAARLEHRMADCAASPYIAIAAVLQAARLGAVNNYALPPAEELDSIDHVSTDRHVPPDLESALLALESDATLVQAVGPGLVANYLAIKRAEIAELGGKSSAEVRDYYLPYI